MRPIRGLATVAAAILAAGLVPWAAAAAATAPQWHRTSADPGRTLAGNATTVSPDGGTVFVTGGAFGRYGLTIAYNAATGAVLWKDKFNPDAGQDDSGFTAIAVSPGGSTVFVAGHSGGVGAGGLVPAIVAYNAATGAELWQATGTLAAGGGASSLVVSPDGGTVYVTSNQVGTTGQTTAYATATGALVWTEQAGGDAIALNPSASALYVSGEPDGTGRTGGSEAFSAATGATLWQASQSGNSVQLKAAGLSPDGSVLFAAGSRASGKKTVGFAVAYSASSGAPLWTVTTGAEATVDGLAVTPGGSVIVSEWINVAANATRWVTRAMDPASGATRWTKARNFTQASAFASALALSPDGSTAYVTGYSDVWQTIGYRTADGTQVWNAGYHGQARNYAYAIAVSGSQVVVTGTSNQGPNTDDVMTTAAYPTG